ncbi:hypothetical protein [Nitrosomonas ureae]|uniref:Uncharacterized protein n=1 Tax=Nitrosomonas ureae TaxID=44577 RepID=A0A2T5IST9_9PROT|nr:hypothetical protein [Nitrosomonas ureae]PTQ86897.1 hypothetical protein C8R28_100892 [Nitrosomonas ureae]
MKRYLLAIALLGSSYSYAAGPYDGIWAMFPYGYLTISERDNILIVVTLVTDEEDGKWSAYQGGRNGNFARLQTIYGNAQVIVDTSFDSLTTAKATIVSCEPNPGYICLFPPGTVLNASKVW